MNNAAKIPESVPAELVFDFDIYADPRINEDVQESYQQTVHENAPDIFYTPANGGHWMITRYSIINEIVMDTEHFSAAEMQIPRIENPPVFIPLSLDPPVNLPYRQALVPVFAPMAIKKMEDKIRYWATKIIDDVIDKGECDFIEDVSSLFPVTIFMELMGLPLDRLREFRELADKYFRSHTEEEIHKYMAEIHAMLNGFIEEKMENPDDGLISHLINVDVDGRKLTQEEVQNMCFVLYLGGMDTVTNVTGFAYRHLAQNPVLQKRLVDNPELISKFVEEGVRCFGVINTPRLVAKDIEKFGVKFSKGDMVLCCLPMASRDERQIQDPNIFNIDRKKIDYLTFSKGPHMCVGHFLARSEIRILTEEWVKRIPSFSLKPNEKHDFRLGTVIALLSLPIEWPTS